MQQWFWAHGDKLLGGVTALVVSLQSSGLISPTWLPVVTGALGVLHTLVAPEPTKPTP